MVIALEPKEDFEDSYLDQNKLLGKNEGFLGNIEKI